MKFNFDWNYVSAGAPYVTVSETSIAFNSPAVSMIGDPEKIVIGFDKDNLAIGVRDASGIEGVKTYSFASRVNNGWVRIGCRDFIKYLSSISGIDFSPAKRYLAKLDSEDNVLYIEVNSERGDE